MTASRCDYCKRSVQAHASWCPEVDVDDAFRALAPRLTSINEAFRTGYAIALIHAGMLPAPAMMETTLVNMRPGELARLAAKIAGAPAPDIEVTARPSARSTEPSESV